MGQKLLTRFDLVRPTRRLVGAVVDLCYPCGCADCGADVHGADLWPSVCDACRASYLQTSVRRGIAATQTPDIDTPGTAGASDVFCRRCGSFAARAVDAPDGTALSPERCPSCDDWKRTGIEGAIPLGRYEDRLRLAVLRMKSPAGDGLSVAIADVLWQTRGKMIRRIGADLIVPVPMHRWRRVVRGASSAERLAERLGRIGATRVRKDVLRRRRNTLTQGGLTTNGRRRNVAGAFRATAGYDLRGLRVVLVDDVLTTGATANEAARVLRRAGASSVYAVVVARTDHAD